MTLWFLYSSKLFEYEISLHRCQLFKPAICGLIFFISTSGRGNSFIVAFLRIIVVLKNSLLEKATVAEEFDKLARFEPLRVHRVAKAAIVAKNTFDNLFLLLLKHRS